MLKLIGAAIVISVATAIGWLQSASYSERPKQLRTLIVGLQRLETAIVYGHSPLDEAFAELGEQLPTPINGLFDRAAGTMRARDITIVTAKEAWLQALKEVCKQTSLKKQDLRILQDFGMSLGVSDKDDQRNHIRHAVKRLEQEELSAREEQGKYGKMYRSLGLLSGILAVILMY
ncbi:stage III sporulation protein SpoIIIAB [Paenibacillus marinisediminis]